MEAQYYLMSLDGKNYVMKNPLQEGRYISTTSPVKASAFTYKQAQQLIHHSKNKSSWIRSYQMVKQGTGETITPSRHSKADIYVGDNRVEIDEDVLNRIQEEVESITGLEAWNLAELDAQETLLYSWLSYVDSGKSDIEHIIGDSSIKPPAHIRTKIYGVLRDLRAKHTYIKQQLAHIEVMKTALKENWTVNKLKAELERAKFGTYKGRTDYYEMIMRWVN